jgi:hypothetical protein
LCIIGKTIAEGFADKVAELRKALYIGFVEKTFRGRGNIEKQSAVTAYASEIYIGKSFQ